MKTRRQQLAADLFNERPTDITCAVTHALSLFFQDNVFEALRIMQSFPPEELRQPEAALYYGIFCSIGDSAKAAEYLALARGAPLLREEEELIARVKRESRLNTLTPSPKTQPQPPKKAE